MKVRELAKVTKYKNFKFYEKCCYQVGKKRTNRSSETLQFAKETGSCDRVSKVVADHGSEFSGE